MDWMTIRQNVVIHHDLHLNRFYTFRVHQKFKDALKKGMINIFSLTHP